MNNTLLPNADDSDKKDDVKRELSSKKEKVIKPLSEQTDNKPVEKTLEVPGASEDVLEELRRKTAELANQVEDTEEHKNRMLVLKDEEEQISEPITNTNDSIEQSESQKSTNTDTENSSKIDPAVEIIRGKLAKLYKKEPDAAEEAIESYQAGKSRSKHQQFMYELTASGKSLADIQTEWHNYYVNLPDEEKHQVWKEFYDTQNQTSKFTQSHTTTAQKAEHVSKPKKSAKPKTEDQRSVSDIKSSIMDKVSAGGKLKASHHFKSLLFGLGLAAFVGLLLSFTFFNEVFIAPFISPSKSVSATPIIGNQSTNVGNEPKILIPKINLEVPVVFGLNSIQENDVQKALEDGVVHYSTTPFPGEKGNSVIVGHSSNNILNSGKYKFAFVLLNRLESEDLFYVQRDGVRYTYKVYEKKVVAPTEVSVLGKQDRDNTMTLITCDPPGTSINRLIVVGEQIFPDPANNKESSVEEIEIEEAGSGELPSNAPSLWSRLWPF